MAADGSYFYAGGCSRLRGGVPRSPPSLSRPPPKNIMILHQESGTLDIGQNSTPYLICCVLFIVYSQQLALELPRQVKYTVMSGFTTTTPSQAWAILNRHLRDEIAPLRLRELCTDNDRVSSLVAVVNNNESASTRIAASMSRRKTNARGNIGNRLLVADLSRQRITLDTLNHLLAFSMSLDIKGFIQTLAWGHNDRHKPFHANHNGNSDRKEHENPHFTFEHDEQAYRSNHGNVALSPSRSVASTLKKTRFAINANSGTNDYADDQTVTSHMHTPTAAGQAKILLTTSPSMHMALRAPRHCDLHMYDSNGVNVLDDIHAEHDRIQMFSDSIRNGKMRGINGHVLQNILVVGRGTACAACEFVYNALKFDPEGSVALKHGISDRKLSSKYGTGRSMRFLSSMDPVSMHGALNDWNPEQTMIVGIIPNGDENDILHLINVLKRWIYGGTKSQSKREETVFGRHFLLVTGSEIYFQTQTVTKAECSFLMQQCAPSEAFTSLSVASLLPLSIAFGWNIVQEILHGAHDLDSHFVETNPRHNLPVLLALVDLWNDHFLPSASQVKSNGGRIISPFMESFSSYPKFVAMIESQVCGRAPAGRTRNLYNKVAPSGTVMDGGLCGTYDRVLYQGGRSAPSELIIAMDAQLPHSQNGSDDYARFLYHDNSGLSSQDHLMCSFFAHADVMATGNMNSRIIRDGQTIASGYTSPTFAGGSTSFDNNGNLPILNAEHDFAGGNHPSTLLLCSRCDAFACGQLIALAEHRAMISARLWDIENPFAFAPSHGSIQRSKQEEIMMDKLESVYQRLDLVGNLGDDDEDADNDDGPKLSLAVKTLLGHYASSSFDKKKASRR